MKPEERSFFWHVQDWFETEASVWDPKLRGWNWTCLNERTAVPEGVRGWMVPESF